MKKTNVLFVDDEPQVLNSLKRGIVGENFNSLLSTNGEDALKIMEENEVGVIVTDMRMPKMNGLDLLRIVKEKYPNTVRMVLSGYAQLPQILATVNAVGVFKFITKPWRMEEEFLVAIREAVNYYEMQKEREELKLAIERKNALYQNLVKTLDEKMMGVKLNGEHLYKTTQQVFNTVKMIANSGDASKDSIRSTFILNYLNSLDPFYKKYFDNIFLEPVEFSTDKMTQELEEFVGKMQLEEVIKIQSADSAAHFMRGSYGILLQILTTLIEQVLKENHFDKESNLNITIHVVPVSGKNKLEIEMKGNYRPKEDIKNPLNKKEVLLMMNFLNESAKVLKGSVSYSQDNANYRILLQAEFLQINR